MKTCHEEAQAWKEQAVQQRRIKALIIYFVTEMWKYLHPNTQSFLLNLHWTAQTAAMKDSAEREEIIWAVAEKMF